MQVQKSVQVSLNNSKRRHLYNNEYHKTCGRAVLDMLRWGELEDWIRDNDVERG
jgi:hypothetical protein